MGRRIVPLCGLWDTKTMTVSEWAAWVGASTGLGSLGWQVYTKVTAGPRLRVSASANFIQRPTGLNRIYYCKVDMVMPLPGGPRFLRITVENIGTAPTTIQSLGFATYSSHWARWRFQPSDPCGFLQKYDGPQLPYKLDVGAEFVGHIQQDEAFNEWLSSGNLWCAVKHSVSGRPVLAKILPE